MIEIPQLITHYIYIWLTNPVTSFMALSRGETWYFPGSLLLQTTRCNFHWLGSCWDNGFSPRWGGAIYDTSLASNQLLWSLLGPNPGKRFQFQLYTIICEISWHASLQLMSPCLQKTHQGRHYWKILDDLTVSFVCLFAIQFGESGIVNCTLDRSKAPLVPTTLTWEKKVITITCFGTEDWLET